MSLPYISIIVPVYNESALLERCLRSLLAQTQAMSCEIIVVDNGSTDDSALIAARCGVRVVTESSKGVCAARQTGFVAAKGEIIISTDADCEYPVGWLREIERRFRRQPDLGLLVGTYRFAIHTRLNRLLWAWERLAIRAHYAFGWQFYVSAANLAYRSKLFDGYDASLGSGGDELYVVRKLRPKGRIGFTLANPVLTSARRLQGRFFATMFYDFGVKYIGSFLLGGTGGGARRGPADIRPGNSMPSSWLLNLFGIVLVLMIVGFVGFGAWVASRMIFAIPLQLLMFIGIIALLFGGQAYCIFWPISQLIMPAPWRVFAREKIVALTFDDGPNEPFTTRIAEIIESYDGHASFFQCGRMVERDPALTKRLVKAGHTIGNHTYDHSFWTLWRPRSLLASIQHTNTILHDAGVPPVRFCRIPWLMKTPIISWAVQRSGMLPVAGRFISLVEVLQPDGERMARRVLRRIKPGSIIILHDAREAKGDDRTQTVKAVEILCRHLAAGGYRFVTLNELF